MCTGLPPWAWSLHNLTQITLNDQLVDLLIILCPWTDSLFPFKGRKEKKRGGAEIPQTSPKRRTHKTFHRKRTTRSNESRVSINMVFLMKTWGRLLSKNESGWNNISIKIIAYSGQKAGQAKQAWASPKSIGSTTINLGLGGSPSPPPGPEGPSKEELFHHNYCTFFRFTLVSPYCVSCTFVSPWADSLRF